MGIFNKKIRGVVARDTFVQWYENILSDKEMASHTGQLREVKRIFPPLKNVRQAVFNEELTTVNIQLLEIAWTKYYMRRGIDMLKALDFMSEVKALVSDLGDYEDAGEQYGTMFSSSAVDGLTPMAELFVSKIMDDYLEVNAESPKTIDEIVQGHSYLFKKTYDIYKNMIERSHIIS